MKSTLLPALCILFIMLTVPAAYAHTVFIVIHGTWSSNSDWYAPGGNFFDTLETSAAQHNAVVVPFRWNGSCGHPGRVAAAQNLAKLIKTYDLATTISIIAHSHGGNVAALASQILSKDPSCKPHTISIIYTLGTPTNNRYTPDMNVIDYVYNLFSFEDLIQPVLGTFSRVHPSHERIANMRVFVNGSEPDHATLHDPCVAQWLPTLHHHFSDHLKKDMLHKKLSEPSIIYFDSTKAPLYAIDTKRKELLEKDQRLSVMILNSFRQSLVIESKMPLMNR